MFGLLMIAFGVGLYRGVRKTSLWMVGPALVVWNGIELIIAGLFPRSEDTAGHIYDPLGVHMMNGMVFFLSIGVVLFVLSLQFARDERWRNLAIYTRVTGIALVVMVVLNGFFAETPADPLHPWLGLFQRIIVGVWFLCLLMLALRLWRIARRGLDIPQNAPLSAPSARVRSDRASIMGIPRWVIVFVVIVILLVLTVVIIENVSGRMGDMRMSLPFHLLTMAWAGHVR
ncbi:hypothetical protein KDI_55520 [Dictyobacter arantiisoli]|uniref:DUF998 domain-containing protein n=1 Tax=Dictyobacter arantiisoli TaxID=2014874 RepID=A0A5A5TL46_9CHLR|nr:hypothetical protein KDI_55520 [Dictyobacter arantiisoli]